MIDTEKLAKLTIDVASEHNIELSSVIVDVIDCLRREVDLSLLLSTNFVPQHKREYREETVEFISELYQKFIEKDNSNVKTN